MQVGPPRAVENTATEQVPPPGEQGPLLNRPRSDGVFGIGFHDFGDLGLESVDVYDVSGKRALYPRMCS